MALVELLARPTRAGRADAAHALQQPRGHQRGVRRRHRRPGRQLEDTRTGATLCDPTRSPVILEKMDFPDPVIEIAHRTPVQGGPGKARRRPAEAGRRRSHFPGLYRSGRAARPSFAAWASCIWTSRSISSSGPTRLKPMSASRRSAIARPSSGGPRSTARTRSGTGGSGPVRADPAVRVPDPASRAPGYAFEGQRSSAATVRAASTSPASREGLAARKRKTGSSPASR